MRIMCLPQNYQNVPEHLPEVLFSSHSPNTVMWSLQICYIKLFIHCITMRNKFLAYDILTKKINMAFYIGL
jgi:hypothetical protein